jgi:membrane protease YdiL (CAAX protease family)
LEYGTPLFLILYVIGGLSPTIFGYIFSKKLNRIKGFVPLVKEYFSVKQPLKYYALMIVFIALYFGVPTIMNGITSGTAWYLGFPLILQMIFFGGLEELGWRYTLQPTLEKHVPFFAASLITACVWAVWHLPLFFIEGVSKGKNFGLFAVGVFGMAFALAAIYRISKSIWICVLFHAVINAFSQVWIISQNLEVVCISAIVTIALSIIVIAVDNHSIKAKKEVSIM